MRIPVSVKYKYYPNAPHATDRSLSLGRWFHWSIQVIGFDLWYVLWLAILKFEFLIASFILSLSYIPLMWILKKKMIEKIDREAIAETLLVCAMSPDERTDYEQKLLKRNRRKAFLVIFILLMLIFLPTIVIIFRS